MLASALAYARHGYSVLPLETRGKRPLTERGVYSSTWQEMAIRQWWCTWPEANIGLAVRPDWVVIDVDVRSGGNDTIKLWPTMPATPTQITASGGMHFVFRRPVGELRGKAAKGVDVLGYGRYIVTAPSVIGGVAYQWVRKLSTTPLAECPQWLVDMIVVPPVSTSSPPRVDNPGDVVERARRYVAAIEGAVSGQGGHAQTFRVAQALVRGFCLDEVTALMLLGEYNARCSPPWRERDLVHKIKSAGQRATMPEGALLVRER